MVITFPRLALPFTANDGIQSVSFTSSENKSVKERRINTVDFILVVMASGFVSSLLERYTFLLINRPATYAMHLECH